MPYRPCRFFPSVMCKRRRQLHPSSKNPIVRLILSSAAVSPSCFSVLSPLYSCDTPVLRFLLDASKTPASLQGSWENEKFLPPLDGALRIPFPAVSDAPPPPSPGKSEVYA